MQKPATPARKPPADKTAGRPPKFQKPESGKLAMDDSTIGSLLALRRKTAAREFDIEDALFASLMKNPNAAVATMKINGKLEGYIVATPISEGWVKGDVQEIKDMMLTMTKPEMDPGLFDKISKAIDSGPFYYLDDFQMAKRGDALLDMVENFHAQLAGNSAKFIAVHGLRESKQFYSRMIKSGGFVKIHENDHTNWFGGKDFVFMVFEKA